MWLLLYSLLLLLGSRKSVALKCIVNALKKVQDIVKAGVILDEASQTADTTILSSQPPNSLFSVNETMTTSKLAQQLSSNNGIYLNVIDEVEGLFESLESKTREVLNRQLWLRLHGGSSVHRSTCKANVDIPTTRMNYCGKCLLYLLLVLDISNNSRDACRKYCKLLLLALSVCSHSVHLLI